MEIKNTAEKALAALKKSGADQSLVRVTNSAAKEFNIEAGKITLLRTTFDQGLTMKAITDQRYATGGGNQFAPETINNLANQVVTSAKASPQDAAYGFAPSQGEKSFEFGPSEPNETWMYDQLDQVITETKKKFPKIILEGTIIKFVRYESCLATSTGTMITSQQGYYDGSTMFTAKDGNKSSSFNYIGFTFSGDDVKNKNTTLLGTCGLEELLRQSSEQIETKRVPEKFTGEVIITPHCMTDIAGIWGGFLSGGPMLKKTSFFFDKLGQKVGSDKITLQSMPTKSNFASRGFVNADGYLLENENIFEKGVLKTYLLNHYMSKKLNQPMSKSGGSFLKMNSGDQSLEKMISNVKKGVLLCRLSSGYPAENGDFSGVAKNSYYIENGKIQFPLTETMVSGNAARMLTDVVDISKETLTSGDWEFPWVRFGGFTIS